MPAFNKIFLIGNLTHDPQMQETSAGAKVTTFGVATNHRYRKADGTVGEWVCFVDVVAWDRLAETCAAYLKKGKLVFVEGRLEYRVWEADGQRRSKHEVHAWTVQFLSPADAQNDESEHHSP